MTREEFELKSADMPICEVQCIEMMISIAAYGSIKDITDENKYWFKKYLSQFVEELGRKRFNEIRDDMVKDLSKAKIDYVVYTDGEGGSYNSMTF